MNPPPKKKPRLSVEVESAIDKVKTSGMLLEYLDRYRDNLEVVMAAVKQNGYALQFASKRLRNNQEVVLAAINSSSFGPEVEIIKLASKELRQDREFNLAVLDVISEDSISQSSFRKFESLQHFLTDPSFAVEALRQLPRTDNFKAMCIYLAADKNDEAIASAAVAVTGYLLKHASEEIRDNREVVLMAVGNYGLALQYASERLKKDREIVSAAVSNNGMALDYAGVELQRDRDIVKLAVQNNGMALYFACPELQGDRAIALIAVQNQAMAFRFISEDLRQDLPLVIAAVKSAEGSDEVMQEIPNDMKANRDVIVSAVSGHGLALSEASEELRDDTDIVMTAIATGNTGEGYGIFNGIDSDSDYCVLRYASLRLRADKSTALAAIAKDVLNLVHVSEELKNDVGLMTTVVDAERKRIDDYGGWTEFGGEVLINRVSEWMDSFEDSVSDWLREDRSHSVMDLGRSWMTEACEKRWLLGQMKSDGNIFPSEIQKMITGYSDIKEDVKQAQETQKLAPLLQALLEGNNR